MASLAVFLAFSMWFVVAFARFVRSRLTRAAPPAPPAPQLPAG
jgi:hypothetical protein